MFDILKLDYNKLFQKGNKPEKAKTRRSKTKVITKKEEPHAQE